MKILENVNIFSLRKKILLVSKLIGIVLIVSYVLSGYLPVSTDVSFVIWLSFVVVLTLVIDFTMAHFISKPVPQCTNRLERWRDWTLLTHAK